ncbi:MAG: class C sortase [Eubacteriales bacterium]|nr:class C sortase [Eubacteriales bacterium]
MKNKIRKFFLLVGVLFVLGGGCVVGYPYVSNWISEYEAEEVILDYRSTVKDEDAESLSDMKSEAEKYNRLLNSDEGVSEADYEDMLAITDSIGFLEIPKLDIYLPIYHSVEERALRRGVGHMPQTSLPVGGPSTHCVLSGHTGLPTAKIFTNLDKMEEGDLFFLHVLDETLAYKVDQILTVLPEDTKDIQIEEGKDLVTLVTCVPYGANTHRLLVRGERTEYNPETISLRASEKEPEEKRIPLSMIIGGAAAVVIIVIIMIVVRRRHTAGKKLKKKED